MKKNKRKPIVLLPADIKQIGMHPFHVVGNKYIMAAAQAAETMPLLVPAISDYLDIDTLLALADGIMLTGSVSNLHPSHFGQSVLDTSLPLDPARDALTLKLVQAAIVAGIPLLAICRGFQEVNVAFGGSLHQAVHAVAGLNDHREADNGSIEARYAPVHKVNLVADGQLAAIVDNKQMMVNSLHGQGIDKLGVGLTAEAYAPDGLIEALSVNNAKAFALGVQWHPEWGVMENPQYLAIFKAFGEACRIRMQRHEPPD
ncbi:MAG: gamma-glutamyl-gamma-aminobutyrate hydrolase [Betaproteobacteria bacterium HGW-Betaproteobacteria-20]|nr:MAG: gamma-glutamyl-gamma-aminobutyrate hydrolase [Betaproteobacteria bacterium HGW-Betaproteobacteria-20]